MTDWGKISELHWINSMDCLVREMVHTKYLSFKPVHIVFKCMVLGKVYDL